MSVARLSIYRQLKHMRDRLQQLEEAIEDFEGDLAEMGGLQAKHYSTRLKIRELEGKLHEQP